MPQTEISLHTLLQEDLWARRLAARLVGAHRADDLVQELWLAVLTTGRRPTGCVRAWLAGILRNLARQQKRGDGRRDRRERAAARPEPVAATGAQAEEAEIARELSDAIGHLAEPYRTAVLGRYMDGMRADEIATANAIPASTVRNRVRRALLRMKERIANRYGGDPRAFFPLGLLLPRRNPSSPAAGRMPWAAAACAVVAFSCFAAADSTTEPPAATPAPNTPPAPRAVPDETPRAGRDVAPTQEQKPTATRRPEFRL
ncbi:MAG: RNA polymerase sigma factor [Planctomycetota bacterium]